MIDIIELKSFITSVFDFIIYVFTDIYFYETLLLIIIVFTLIYSIFQIFDFLKKRSYLVIEYLHSFISILFIYHFYLFLT